MLRARLAAIAVLAGAALAVAGCASSGSASWTYAPASPATPAASAAASASAGASGAPSSPASSAAASAAASAEASGGSGGATASVKIVASGIQFTTTDVTAPAGQGFTLTFSNQDAGTPHNVDIKDSSGATVFKTDIFSGVADKTFQVPALKAGSYPFVCDVHPNMTGTLTVK